MKKNANEIARSLAMVTQLGVSMLAPVVLCAVIGNWMDERFAGIVFCAVVIQIIELCVAAVQPAFAGSVFSFAVGLWIGIATAVGLAVHMYHSIDRALDMAPKDAEGYVRKAYLIRTVFILAVVGIVYFFHLGYVMATFLGVLCLKFGAFLQPLMHKLKKKFQK